MMGAATAASRGIGFVRIWAIATILGTTYLGNTYQSSSAVSNVLFELLAAGALSAVLVPTFVRHLERDDHAEAERLASRRPRARPARPRRHRASSASSSRRRSPGVIASGAPEHLKADQQELATFLTRFFVFQILLYAIGTVSTAVLFAKRRFVAFALAPIANTVAVVGALIVFRILTGPHPSLDLTGTEQLVLALGGHARRRSASSASPPSRSPAPASACGRGSDASTRSCAASSALDLGRAPARRHRDPARARAIVDRQPASRAGVVAYQFAFVAIMAPYGILAEPVHTTILPELSHDAAAGDHGRFATQLRWALDNMALLIVPVSAIAVALALPMMRVIAVGQSKGGAGVLAAALASLALGLYPYSAFLLFARALYALDDSRTPAARRARHRRDRARPRCS